MAALAGLFVQALRLCQQAGLVKLGNVAIDGTKILANASTRRSVPYQKICERESYWQQTVDRLLAEAQRMDEQEDQLYGKGQPADPLPAELAHARSRLERLRQAKTELEREAQQHLEELQQIAPSRKRGRPPKGTHPPPQNAPRRENARKRLQRARRNAAAPSRQYNFVDPDSRVMQDNARKCFVQGYNAQIAADSQAQVIVAAELTQQTNDRQQLVPMTQAVRDSTGAVPETLTADAGYWDTISLQDPALEGIEVLVPPDSLPQPPGALLPSNAPKNAESLRMREVLASESGRARYSLRKAVVEPVFGQIKEVRGIRRFRLRGLERASGEWKLICATHNLLKLFRYRSGKGPDEAPKRSRRASSGCLALRVGFFLVRGHSQPDSFAAIIAVARIN